MATEIQTLLEQMNSTISAEYDVKLQEAVGDLALRLDTIGWVPADGFGTDEGMTLEALKQTSKVLRDMVATNPIIKSADRLRHGYVFGRGMTFSNLAPRHNKIMEDAFNNSALFSTSAWEELSRARLTDGNLFILHNKSTNSFVRIPLEEITGYVTDPQSSENVWYFKREWQEQQGNDTPRNRKAWYPTAQFLASAASNGARQKTISSVQIDRGSQIFHAYANRQIGFALGIPDGYAAMVWTIAYSEYLKNNSKLVAAYAKIAYKFSTQTVKGANQSAVQMASAGTAGVASMGTGQDLVPMPRAGSDVSFENGRPLAAMVAASLGVSVVALLSDPGAAGSSYGSAQTLDAPTIISMSVLQDEWRDFYTSIFTALKGDKVVIEFPSIETDQVYKQIESLKSAFQSGGLFQEEWRAALLDLLSIENPKDGLPVPNQFTLAQPTPDEAQKAADKVAKATADAAAAAQKDNGPDAKSGATDNSGREDTQSSGANGTSTTR